MSQKQSEKGNDLEMLQMRVSFWKGEEALCRRGHKMKADKILYPTFKLILDAYLNDDASRKAIESYEKTKSSTTINTNIYVPQVLQDIKQSGDTALLQMHLLASIKKVGTTDICKLANSVAELITDKLTVEDTANTLSETSNSATASVEQQMQTLAGELEQIKSLLTGNLALGTAGVLQQSAVNKYPTPQPVSTAFQTQPDLTTSVNIDEITKGHAEHQRKLQDMKTQLYTTPEEVSSAVNTDSFANLEADLEQEALAAFSGDDWD